MDMYQKLRTTNAYQSKAASWMRVGDRVTNNFFEVVKCKGSETQPSCLTKTGVIKNLYYHSLYIQFKCNETKLKNSHYWSLL